MYDKPTEKNKTKLTGFQLAGAVLAALLLVVGGALTLYRSGDEHKINVGMQQPSIDSSESLDSTELTADLEQAQNDNGGRNVCRLRLGRNGISFCR